MENWNKIEFIFCFKLHIAPSELERLEFYRIEYIIKQYEEYVEKENKQYEKQQSDTEKQYKSSNSSPNYGNYKPPKMDMPKIDMPKFDMPKY